MESLKMGGVHTDENRRKVEALMHMVHTSKAKRETQVKVTAKSKEAYVKARERYDKINSMVTTGTGFVVFKNEKVASVILQD